MSSDSAPRDRLLEAARTLVEVSRAMEKAQSHAKGADDPDEIPKVRKLSFVDLARRLYKQRAVRRRYIGHEFFGEPDWDMLLDLYIAMCEGEQRSVKSVSIASHCPPTTALRYLKVLEKNGMIEIKNHDFDKRVRSVCLSTAGAEKMNAYLTFIATR